ncbi:hypothetical protein DB30_02573 [Enhygromyxa salina]|uniref:Uncharacterized protein n=2 Tax=Enhygromyxa salina TaxID=215803 RepID=A0A0C1Z2R2_9BACT|nr:hypothetical protein DB30_02573 [Enhygromyxa salina]
MSALALAGPLRVRAVLLERPTELKYERCVQAIDELREEIGAERGGAGPRAPTGLGVPLYPMAAGDIVAATTAGLARALTRVPEPQGLLLFNCGGRLWEARARGLVEQLGTAMLPIPGAGFTT